MRDFIDSIFSAIGSTSLTDEEYGWVQTQTQAFSLPVYAELTMILDAREDVSGTKDRLKFYFKAKGANLDAEAAAAKSNILLGRGLWT